MTVTGQSNLQIIGGTSLGITGSAVISNGLIVTGQTNLQSIASTSLGISGNTIHYNSLTVSGSTILNNGLNVTGQSIMQATTILSTLNVSGSTIFNSLPGLSSNITPVNTTDLATKQYVDNKTSSGGSSNISSIVYIPNGINVISQNTFTVSGDFSIEGWINIFQNGSNPIFFSIQSTINTSTSILQLYQQGGGQFGIIINNSGTVDYSNAGSPNSGQWYHILITGTTGTTNITFYLNGSKVTPISPNSTVINSMTNCKLYISANSYSIQYCNLIMYNYIIYNINKTFYPTFPYIFNLGAATPCVFYMNAVASTGTQNLIGTMDVYITGTSPLTVPLFKLTYN